MTTPNHDEKKEELKSTIKGDQRNYRLSINSLTNGVADTIKLYIYPFGSVDNPVSHAALEYNGNVIDYSSHGFSPKIGRHTDCYIYEIDPQKAGIDTAKLEAAISARKNQIKGKNYNYLTENCADQIVAVLEEAGVKDIKKTLGISIPMLNGVPSLDDWAEKHGTLFQTPTFETGRPNVMHYAKALTPKSGSPAAIKYNEDRKKIRNCIEAICNPAQYKKDIKEKYDRKCAKDSFMERRKANQEYGDNYIISMLPQEALAEQVAKILSEYPDDSRYKKMIINSCCALISSASRKNTLSEKTKGLLHNAGFPDKYLGREEKQKPSKKTRKNDSQPIYNIYYNGGTQNA